jgi:D-arginine dehydrogenase
VNTADVVVIGGGIAGVTAAFHLAPHGSVALLEREKQLAHHTTGRSAAIFLENYGGPVNQRLSIGSRAFLESRADGLADVSLMNPEGMLDVGGPDALAELRELAAAGAALVPSIRLLDEAEILELAPIIRPGVVVAGVWEPEAASLDVMALHQAFVRGARNHGAVIERDATVLDLTRRHGVWTIDSRSGQWQAPIVVNAAGAWGDVVGHLAGASPVGLQPMRRTAFTVPTEFDTSTWPVVNHNLEPRRCYFKPEAGGQLLCSPADETPSEPCDARPEEIDVARAIDAINQLTTLDIRSVKSTWAGLRTFAPDRDPVLGWDDEIEGFCWMVGQGGTGIQTSPASGAAVAAIVAGDPLPQRLRELGLTETDLAPRRARSSEGSDGSGDVGGGGGDA